MYLDFEAYLLGYGIFLRYCEEFVLGLCTSMRS